MSIYVKYSSRKIGDAFYMKRLAFELVQSNMSKSPCTRTQQCWMLHVASVCTPCCISSSPVQTDATLLDVTILRPFAHPVACCCVFLGIVVQSLKPVKHLNQQLPTFLLFRDRRSVVQQCWIRLHSSFKIVWATHSH